MNDHNKNTIKISTSSAAAGHQQAQQVMKHTIASTDKCGAGDDGGGMIGTMMIIQQQASLKRHSAYKPQSSQFARQPYRSSSSDSVIKNEDEDSQKSQLLEANDY